MSCRYRILKFVKATEVLRFMFRKASGGNTGRHTARRNAANTAIEDDAPKYVFSRSDDSSSC
jgi:hypothetical protein